MLTVNKSPVLLAKLEDTIETALSRMCDAKVGSILVVDKAKVVGIITERDVLKNWRRLSDPSFLKQTVSELMSQPVYALETYALDKAPSEMIQRRIRHIPVIDEKKQLVGILSARDILAQYVAKEEKEAARPRVQHSGEMLFHIVTPTEGLETILRDILPVGWTCKPWRSSKDILFGSEFKKEVTSGNAVVFVDLDGIAPEERRKLLRELIAMMSGPVYPHVFLCLTEELNSRAELQVLEEIAKKTRWNVFERPIAIAALISALETV